MTVKTGADCHQHSHAYKETEPIVWTLCDECIQWYCRNCGHLMPEDLERDFLKNRKKEVYLGEPSEGEIPAVSTEKGRAVKKYPVGKGKTERRKKSAS